MQTPPTALLKELTKCPVSVSCLEYLLEHAMCMVSLDYCTPNYASYL